MLKIASEDIKRFPHIAGMSPRTSKLIELFKESNVGDALTDEIMSRVAGGNTAVGGECYGNLQSACRYVRVHYGIIVERVPGASVVKILNAPETVASVERGRRTIGRRIRREGSKLGHVDFAKLEGVTKSTALVLRAQFGALASFANTHTTKRLTKTENLDEWLAQQRKMLKAM